MFWFSFVFYFETKPQLLLNPSAIDALIVSYLTHAQCKYCVFSSKVDIIIIIYFSCRHILNISVLNFIRLSSMADSHDILDNLIVSHPIIFPCGRKPEHPDKTNNEKWLVLFYTRTRFESHWEILDENRTRDLRGEIQVV